ncbi:hypothetical protein [Methylobacterium nodulans]|uniref:hypothetical protein n=1 Tax=Methylobacterium nodulans TaxID=114616 RepID=UPI0012ECFC69|nr:hypothetical protein [Methylobacterium nodulans]
MRVSSTTDRLDAMTHLAIGLIMRLGKARVIRGHEALNLLKVTSEILQGDLGSFYSCRANVSQTSAKGMLPTANQQDKTYPAQSESGQSSI